MSIQDLRKRIERDEAILARFKELLRKAERTAKRTNTKVSKASIYATLVDEFGISQQHIRKIIKINL